MEHFFANKDKNEDPEAANPAEQEAEPVKETPYTAEVDPNAN